MSPRGRATCDGHTTAGKPCGNAPIRGGFTCRQRHGGGAPQVLRTAKLRLAYLDAEGDVARLLREADVPGGIHPLDGLLDVVARTGGMVSLLGRLTGQLDTNPATTWETVALGRDAYRQIRTTNNAALTGYDDRGNQAPDVLLELYGRWLRLYLDACRAALSADVDERAVRNATATSDTFFRAVHAGMLGAGFTAEQQDQFSRAVAAELRRQGVVSELLPTT